ncbi:MAG: VOC family protein [Pseudomonadota bacterium]
MALSTTSINKDDAMSRMMDYGQPLGSIMQVAYVVDDLEKAAQHWVDALGIGPWIIMPHFPAEDMHYRGTPTDIDLSIALAYSGSMCFELIFQHNEVPSVYREDGAPTREGRFHHWAIATERFDDVMAKHKTLGHAVAFDGKVVPVGGLRFAYIDAMPHLGGMIEVIESGPPVEELFAGVKQVADNWDGKTVVIRP